jgi:hypothetical protein
MNRLITAVALSLFAVTAAAQTGGLPPEQAPAGNPGKLMLKKNAKPADATTPVPADATTPKPVTPTDKRAARKAKRAEKVGPKPLD